MLLSSILVGTLGGRVEVVLLFEIALLERCSLGRAVLCFGPSVRVGVGMVFCFSRRFSESRDRPRYSYPSSLSIAACYWFCVAVRFVGFPIGFWREGGLECFGVTFPKSSPSVI